MEPITYVEAWVGGWVHSRECHPPIRVHGTVLRIETGTAKEVRRWVPLDPAEETLARVLEEAQQPTCCVKFAGDPDAWLPRFGPDWDPDEPGWFMTRALEPSGAQAAPPGYVVERSVGDHLAAVRVLDPAGGLAARGRCGIEGGWAVPDQIVTEESHRRRGLGRVVMSTLAELVTGQGATRAVLSASADGRELYRSLGWREQEPIVAAYRRRAGA